VTPTNPLPPRIAWFAPWTWNRKRRSFWLIVPVLIIAYPLSLGPMLWLSDRHRLPQWANSTLECVYFPLLLVVQTDLGDATLGRYVGFWKSLP
jgi:hypothetical protein